MKWRRYGRNGILVEFAERPDEESLRRCRAMVQTLERNPPDGLLEFVPAYTTLLLEFDLSHSGRMDELAKESVAFLERCAAVKLPARPVHRIPVRYGGPDLSRVARHNGLTEAEAIARHCGRVYEVYFLGFSPGFPYLGELDRRLHTPRLSLPRPKVRAGSVGIGGEQTGIYTVESPGGWNIIGQTDVKLFDLSRAGEREEDAFPMRIGDKVQFEPV